MVELVPWESVLWDHVGQFGCHGSTMVGQCHGCMMVRSMPWEHNDAVGGDEACNIALAREPGLPLRSQVRNMGAGDGPQRAKVIYKVEFPATRRTTKRRQPCWRQGSTDSQVKLKWHTADDDLPQPVCKIGCIGNKVKPL